MADRIGMTRNINEEYLNTVANCKIAGKSLLEARDILNAMIGTRIHAETNIKNTRIILLNTWYRNDPWFQESCVKLAKQLPEPERLPLHWALLMIAYPVFYDLCTIIGGTLEYRDHVSSAQIKGRISEVWGARTTLLHALPKNLQTMKDIRVLEPLSIMGTYKPISHVVDDRHVMCILAAAILKCSDHKYMTWEHIIHHPALFPFEIRHVTQADIAACERFILERMGDDVVIRLKE